MQTPILMMTQYLERKRKSKLRPARRKHNVVATVKRKQSKKILKTERLRHKPRSKQSRRLRSKKLFKRWSTRCKFCTALSADCPPSTVSLGARLVILMNAKSGLNNPAPNCFNSSTLLLKWQKAKRQRNNLRKRRKLLSSPARRRLESLRWSVVGKRLFATS